MPFAPELVHLIEAGPEKPYDWTVGKGGLSWTEPGPGGRTVVVPEGFRTDLASVPRFLSWLFPRYGKYTKAGVVHDYLCQHLTDLAPGAGGNVDLSRLTLRDRSDADAAFLDMMSELDVPWARRLLMYSAVSWATVLTVLTARPAAARVWLARALLVLLVVAIAALVWTGALGSFVDDGSDRAWLQVTLVIAAVFALATAWVAITGVVALGRADRLWPYLGAAGFTVISLPLIAGGLAVGVLLVAYLLVEDVPSGFKSLRSRFRRRGQPDNPRHRRIGETTESTNG